MASDFFTVVSPTIRFENRISLQNLANIFQWVSFTLHFAQPKFCQNLAIRKLRNISILWDALANPAKRRINKIRNK